MMGQGVGHIDLRFMSCLGNPCPRGFGHFCEDFHVGKCLSAAICSCGVVFI